MIGFAGFVAIDFEVCGESFQLTPMVRTPRSKPASASCFCSCGAVTAPFGNWAKTSRAICKVPSELGRLGEPGCPFTGACALPSKAGGNHESSQISVLFVFRRICRSGLPIGVRYIADGWYGMACALEYPWARFYRQRFHSSLPIVTSHPLQLIARSKASEIAKSCRFLPRFVPH